MRRRVDAAGGAGYGRDPAPSRAQEGQKWPDPSPSPFLERAPCLAVGSDTNHTAPLVVLTTLFFMWGGLTSLNDILIPHLKAMF